MIIWTESCTLTLHTCGLTHNSIRSQISTKAGKLCFRFNVELKLQILKVVQFIYLAVVSSIGMIEKESQMCWWQKRMEDMFQWYSKPFYYNHSFNQHKNMSTKSVQWWVLSTPFDMPFHLQVQYQNRGSGPFNICKWLVQKDFKNISASFKTCFLWFLLEKECSFYTALICCTEMRRMFISSTTISVTGLVASRARCQLTSSKCKWTRIWTI